MKKTTKVVLALVLVCVLALSFAACGKKEKDPAADGLLFGISMGELTSTFCEGLRDGVMEKCDDLGVKYEYACADSDATKQAEQITNMISLGCDAVLAFATDTDAIMASGKECKDAGVIFGEFSRISPDLTNIDVACGFDNKDQAVACAQAIVDGAKAAGYAEIKCIELVGSLTDQNAIERKDYFEEFAKDNGITIVSTVNTDWDKEVAYNGLKDAYTAVGGDFNAIYCPSDTFFTTCETFLTENNMYKAIGEEGHVIVVGIDGGSDAIPYCENNMFDYICNTDVLQLGRETTQYVYDVLMEGKTYDEAIMISIGDITPENASDEALWGNVYAK